MLNFYERSQDLIENKGTDFKKNLKPGLERHKTNSKIGLNLAIMERNWPFNTDKCPIRSPKRLRSPGGFG
jgi:hypothetical protein